MTNLANKALAAKSSSLAIQLIADGYIPSGLAMHRRAVSLDPENWRNRALLVGALINEGYLDEAEPLIPGLPEDEVFVQSIKGFLHVEKGDVKSGLPYFKYAAEKDGSPLAVFDYAFMTLLSGDFEKGLPLYECRTEYKKERAFPDGCPRWNGSRVKSLLCWSEQGTGDLIQFARYLPWLSTQVDKVLFAAPENMLALMDGYKKYCEVVPNYAKVDFNAEVPLLSVPLFHKTTMDTIPLDPGLLNIGTAVGSLKVGNKLRVGFTWSGNPQQNRNRRREIPFPIMLEALASNPNFELYSLQCGSQGQDISKYGAQSLVTDLSGIIKGDWSATGAVLRELDILVSPCTGVAHLAGALGVPVSLCLHNAPDWRWFMGTDRTPWYPSMKLYRQKVPHSWKEVLLRITRDLETRLNTSLKVVA